MAGSLMHNLNEDTNLTSRLVAAAMQGNMTKKETWALQNHEGVVTRLDGVWPFPSMGPSEIYIVQSMTDHEKAGWAAKKYGGKAVKITVWEIVEVED